MVKVVAKFVIQKDKIDEFKDTIPKIIAETRKEAGCIAYQLFQDVKDANVLTLLEEWESLEALDRHMKTTHFVEEIPKLTALQEKELEINVYNLVM